MLLIERILETIAPITPDKDAKLACFLQKITSAPLAGKKLLIFTQYTDTARYIGAALEKRGLKAVETIASSEKDKARVVARFAPVANAVIAERFPNDAPIEILVATDVLSEGLNMQDGDTLIDYDLHWNPVRLIQRFGRIDRIGTTNATIYGFNFLPETGLGKNLGLQEKLARRIAEIHAALGENAAILSPDETLNEAAMRAIYAGKDAGNLFEIEEIDELASLSEAEASLRALRREDPQEWKRLNALRAGIRSGKRAPGSIGRRIVMCRAGEFRSLMLLSPSGEIESRDATKILSMMASERDEAAMPLLPNHNEIVMKAREDFWREARLRRQNQKKAGKITPAQEYARRELDIAFARSEDGDLKNQILMLKKVFEREGLPSIVRRELNHLKKSGIVGEVLIDELVRIYAAHGLSQRVEIKRDDDDHFFPQIVCSLSLS
ncbi:Helicase conserved C-terminal domain-containing protein [Abditibacterium utsteinense]|uniref:Helicase conserved C-terminal domain-containing protein n=1 Tax=Abditibacterium utsteinense TaxID=1960156 RepID=A0A2S8STA5_9BACT|nr:Helicase conserved C-terminal domain-containing protein [Abditibacterium utsteinense]